MSCRRGCAGGQIEVVAPPTRRTAGTPFTVCCDCDDGVDLFRRRSAAASAPGSRMHPPSSITSYLGGWIIHPWPRDLVPLDVSDGFTGRHMPDRAALARDLAPTRDEQPPIPDQRLGWRADGDEPADGWG